MPEAWAGADGLLSDDDKPFRQSSAGVANAAFALLDAQPDGFLSTVAAHDEAQLLALGRQLDEKNAALLQERTLRRKLALQLRSTEEENLDLRSVLNTLLLAKL